MVHNKTISLRYLFIFHRSSLQLERTKGERKVIRRLLLVAVTLVISYGFAKWGDFDASTLTKAWALGFVATMKQIKTLATSLVWFTVMILCVPVVLHDFIAKAKGWEAEIKACFTTAVLFYGVGFVATPFTLYGSWRWLLGTTPVAFSLLALLPLASLFFRRPAMRENSALSPEH